MKKKMGRRRIELRAVEMAVSGHRLAAARLNSFDLDQLGHRIPTVCFFATSQPQTLLEHKSTPPPRYTVSSRL